MAGEMRYLAPVSLVEWGREAIWIAVVAAIVVSLAVALLVARRLYLKRPKQAPAKPFSMASIQSLRDGGQITSEEFARLRRAALGLGRLKDQHDKTESSTDAEVDDGSKDAADRQRPGQ